MGITLSNQRESKTARSYTVLREPSGPIDPSGTYLPPEASRLEYTSQLNDFDGFGSRIMSESLAIYDSSGKLIRTIQQGHGTNGASEPSLDLGDKRYRKTALGNLEFDRRIDELSDRVANSPPFQHNKPLY